MRTLGIDLASQDKKTAFCAIEWVSEMALVDTPRTGRPESELLDAMGRADWLGIDAPFGWPDEMVAAIYNYAHSGSWPASATSKKLRYRQTDWFVRDVIKEKTGTSVWPLSVSSDRIAVCAWRCARLLSEHAARSGWQFDRVGVPLSSGMDGPPDAPRPTGVVSRRGVVEVYPAGALALWRLPHKGYKANSGLSAADARTKRIATMASLERQAGAWLVLSEDVREACIDGDDAFDAFIASLVACAAATDSTFKPLVAQRGAAQREGWIHLPQPDSLASLAPGSV
jgi:hypothetical protein